MPRFEITSSESGPVFSNYSKSGGHGSTGQVKAGSWGKKSIKIGNVRCNKNSLIDYLNTQATLTKPLKKGRLLGWGGSSDTAVSDAVTLVFTKKQVSAPPRPAMPPKPETKFSLSSSTTKDSSSSISDYGQQQDPDSGDSSDDGFNTPFSPLPSQLDSLKDIPQRSSSTEDSLDNGFKTPPTTIPLKTSSSSSSESPIPIDWRALTPAQLKDSDFKTIDKKSFNAIFPWEDRTKICLQSYSSDQIATLQKHFDAWHWKNLSDAQLEDLDFTSIDKRVFDYIFPISLEFEKNSSKTRLQSYSSDKIVTMKHHFEGWHWRNLSNFQVNGLDFTKIDKKDFENLFPCSFSYEMDFSKTRLQSYSSDKIETMQHLFWEWHWRNLSDTQVAHLDFTTIDKKTFDNLFPISLEFETNISKTRLQSCSSDKLATMQHLFEPWHWRHLSDLQVEHFNFTTMDKKTFNDLFPFWLDEEKDLSKARLQSYSSDKIATMEHLFAPWHKRAIKD